jgi:hypothetical protein
MKRTRGLGLLLALVLLGGCAATKQLSAVGNAALRAGGISTAERQPDVPNPATAEADKPHWSEEWVWEGDRKKPSPKPKP